MTEIELIGTPALGDNSYLVVSGDEAVIVDPQRDAWRLLGICADRRLHLRFVVETHVHNDYLSGARELQAATGAVIAGPAGAAFAFAHRPLDDGDELALGEATLRAVATPGHTPEHTAYALYDVGAAVPSALFTGGSLLVGGTGRTDLLGGERAEELARAQFASLRRLLTFGEETRVLPTHGAGSFCAAATSGPATSTLGEQRRSNPALRLLADEEEFVRDRLRGLPRYPAYYRHMAPINRAGPGVLGGLPTLPSLAPDELSRLIEAGAWTIDVRDRWSFARAHIPGSVNVELDDSFTASVGSVTPFGTPLVLVVPETEKSGADAVTQLVRIGYDTVGFLAGGIAAWQAAGRPLSSYPARGIEDLDALDPGVLVLDVRQPSELGQSIVPSSWHIVLGDLPARLGELPLDRTVWTVCATGRRAAVAASLLDRAGVDVVAVARGGAPTWVGRAA